MHTALWPATFGYFLDEVMNPLVSDAAIGRGRTLFEKFVRPRGPFPSLALGGQPYGVLPVSSLAGWRTAQAAEDPLAKILNTLRAQWLTASAKVPRSGQRRGRWRGPRRRALAIARLDTLAGADAPDVHRREDRVSRPGCRQLPGDRGSAATCARRGRASAPGADRRAARPRFPLLRERVRVECPTRGAGRRRADSAAPGQLHLSDRRRCRGSAQEQRRRGLNAAHAPLPAAAPRDAAGDGARGRSVRTPPPTRREGNGVHRESLQHRLESIGEARARVRQPPAHAGVRGSSSDSPGARRAVAAPAGAPDALDRSRRRARAPDRGSR